MHSRSVADATSTHRRNNLPIDPALQARKIREILEDSDIQKLILGLKDFEALAKRFENDRTIQQVSDEELTEFAQKHPLLARTIVAAYGTT